MLGDSLEGSGVGLMLNANSHTSYQGSISLGAMRISWSQYGTYSATPYCTHFVHATAGGVEKCYGDSKLLHVHHTSSTSCLA